MSDFTVEVIQSSDNIIEIVNTEKILASDMPYGYPIDSTLGNLPYARISGLSEGVQDIIGASVSGISGINVTYDDISGLTRISLSNPIISTDNIVDFNSGVSGLIPVKDIIKTEYTNIVSSGGEYSIYVTGLQPLGNYTTVGHLHTTNNITNFNSGVSGLLPVTAILAGTGIGISQSGSNFSISVTGAFGLTQSQVDNRINILTSGLVNGVGNSGYLSKWSNTSGLNSSLLYDDGNNIGIGTSNPDSKLHVVGSGIFTSGINTNSIVSETVLDLSGTSVSLYSPGEISLSSDALVHIHPTGGTVNLGNDVGYNSLLNIYGSLNVDNGIGSILNVDHHGSIDIDVPANGKILLAQSASSGSKIGIKTSNPLYDLDVNGSGNFTSLNVGGVPVSVSGHSHLTSNITNFNSSVSGLINGIYAPLNSPAFIGTPTVPTANSGTNTTQIASTAFVRTEISNLVSAAPSTLDTLNELATALGNDPNFATTVTNNLAGKANLNGATFTGGISGPSGNFTILRVNNVDVSASGHIHSISNITGLQTALDGKQPSGNYALSSHTHTSSDITNFNASVDSRITNANLQPSGNYALSSHTHLASNITDFNSSVSGLLPVRNVLGSGFINVSSLSGNFTVSVTGVQPSGNYSIVGHSHVSSDITNFNSSVSGLLPITNLIASSGINITQSGTVFTISGTGTGGGSGLNEAQVDARVNILTSGIYAPLNGSVFTGSVSGPSGNFTVLRVNDVDVSASGHSHISSDITNFNSSVSGLLTPYQLVLTNPVTGVGTSGYYPRWTSGSTISSGMIFDNGSGVGIGTDSPLGTLDVRGDIRVSGVSGTQTTIWLSDNNGPTWKSITHHGNEIRFNSNRVIAGFGVGVRGNYGENVGIDSNGANGYLALAAGGGEKVRIATDGSVGIGTTTPSGQLHVIGRGIFSSGLSIGSTATPRTVYISGASAAQGELVRIQNGSSTNNSYLDIGVGTPGNFDDHIIFSRGTGVAVNTRIFGIDNTNRLVGFVNWAMLGNTNIVSFHNANSYIQLQNLTNDEMSIGAVSGITFLSQSSARMRMDRNGNLGIGTSSPNAQLHVVGSGNFTSDVISSGSIIVGSGSASLPSFEFINDPNTGMFNPFADNLGFSTGGTERLRIDNTGRIGVGTGIPSGQLHMELSVPNNSYLLLSNPGNVIKTHIGIGNSDTVPFLASTNNIQLASGTFGWGFFDRGTDGNLHIQRRNTNTAWISTMMLDRTNGNVGIGTGVQATTPPERLVVDGNLRLADLSPTSNRLQLFRGGGTAFDYSISKEGNHMALSTANDSGVQRAVQVGAHITGVWTPRIHMNGWTGQVGLNTISPQAGFILDANGSIVIRGSILSNSVIQEFANGRYQLHSAATSNAYSYVCIGGGSFGVGFAAPSGRVAISGGVSIGSDYNLTPPTNGLIVQGNVGIGTSAPSTRLHISSTGNNDTTLEYLTSATGFNSGVQPLKLMLTGSSGVAVGAGVGLDFITKSNITEYIGGRIQTIRTDSSNNHALTFLAGGGTIPLSEYVRIASNGNVGIGLTNPASNLHVSGIINSNTEFRLGNPYSRVAIMDAGGGFAGGYNIYLSGTTPKHNSIGTSAGYYYHTDGSIRLYTNSSQSVDTDSVERLRVLSNGRVGINTTTPSGHLDVAGDVYVRGTGNALGTIYLKGSGTSDTSLRLRVDSNSNMYLDSTNGSQLRIGHNDGAAELLGASTFVRIGHGYDAGSANQNIQFRPANIERMRITNTGLVGIGTTTPSGQLHVIGTGLFSENLLVNNIPVSVSGHSHLSSDISNFNSSVSGLLPVLNIVAGTNVTVSNTSGVYTINSTGGGGGGSGIFNVVEDTSPQLGGNLDLNSYSVSGIGNININGSGSFASGLNISNQIVNTIASFDSLKNIISLDTSTYPSLTELSFVKGVTSNLQTQINNKQNILTNPVTGTGIVNHIAYWNSSSGIVADSGQLFWDNSNNRLGIGTSAPSETLDVSGNIRSVGLGGSGDLVLGYNSIYNGYGLSNNSATQPLRIVSDNSQMILSSPEGIYIDGDFGNTIFHTNVGFVGIGKDIPTEKLHLKGNFIVEDSAINSVISVTEANGLTLFLNSEGGGTGFFFTDRANGRIGIGVPIPEYKLDVNGDFRISGSGIFGQNIVITGIPTGTTETDLILVKADGTLVKRSSSVLGAGVSEETSIINSLIFG